MSTPVLNIDAWSSVSKPVIGMIHLLPLPGSPRYGGDLCAIREAALVKGTVVKEMCATFSPAPGSDRWRPEQRSPLAGLFLAGDWTATGWPSTMEGAVRSGYLAAEAILADAGAPRKILQPDLRPEGLSGWWSRES